MRTVLLRGLATRRLRTGLSVFAVVLGVAFVTGALMLGSALRSASDDLAGAAYDDTAAVVSAPGTFTTTDLSANATIPAATVERVRATAGVTHALGEIIDEAKIVDAGGEPLGSSPYFGVGLDSDAPGAAQVSPFRLVDGRWAHGGDQVVIDQISAERLGVSVGDRARIAAGGPARSFTVTGIALFGTVPTLGPATAAVFDLRTAQELFGKPGRVDDVLVAGPDAGALRARLADTLGGDVAVRTAAAHDRFDLEGLDGFVAFLRTALLVFGGIAVVVGAMTIANALGLTVAQRSRELALLRATGASRRQVLRSVLVEAGMIGAVGSAIGLVAGIGLAEGLLSLLTSSGLEMPTTGLELTAGTIAVGVVTGLGATLVAALTPALRAARIAPVAALRGEAVADAEGGRRGTIAGLLAGLAGAALMAYALLAADMTAGERLTALAPGAIAVLVAVALLQRHVVVPVASLLGAPAARLGVAGRLARGSTARHPRRTASATAALMIGVALVTFVAVLAGGLKSAASGEIESTVRSQQVIAGSDGWSPVSPGVVAAARDAGATRVTALTVDEARTDGDATTVAGVDPAAFASVTAQRWTAGSPATLRGLRGDGAVVRRDFATQHDLAVGSRFAVTAADGGTLRLRVRGIVKGSPIDPLGLGQVLVAQDAFERTFSQRRPKLVLVDGASAAALDRALVPFPDAQRRTPAELADDVAAEVDGALGLVTALLALAVIISVLGIITTLALGVTERTRELGMLRAVGMTRRQLRRMIRLEGALTALVGAGVGVVTGLGLAAAVTAALADQGLELAVPVGTIAAYVVVAGLAGVLAAALPARRAGRLRVLTALTYE